MVAFIDEHRDAVRGRADLRRAADRPVDVLRAQGPAGRSATPAGACPARRGAAPSDPAGLGGELPGLRRAQGLAAAAARGHPRGALHGRAADAAAGPAGAVRGRTLPHDDPGRPRRPPARSRPARSSPPRARTSSGWRTSPTWRPGRASSTWPSSSTSSRAASSAGGSRARCAPTSRSMRSSRRCTRAGAEPTG